MSRKPVDLFQLSWQEFEQLCADLLRCRQLLNVKIQGKNCPAFDIIADELLHCSFTDTLIRWGVQCKRERKNVRPKVFDDVITEARSRDIKSVLVISASDFTDRTVRTGELLQKKHPELLKVDFWNADEVRSQLARYPLLLNKYFNMNVKAILKDINNPDLLMEYLSEVSGAPIKRIEDLLVETDFGRFTLKAGRALYSGGDRLPVAKVLDRYKNPEQPHANAPEVAARHESYDEFIELEHITTLSDLPRSPRSAVWQSYQKLTDVVSSKVILNEPDRFRFVFAMRQEDWDTSHVLHSNEYTWLLGGPIDDFSKIDKFIIVKNMTVDGLRLRCLRRITKRNIITIIMGAKALRKKWGKEVRIKYTVENLHPKDTFSMYSSTHAPAQLYRFTLTSKKGFRKKPTVKALFGRVHILPETIYCPQDAPSSVIVRATGPVSRQAGIVINW